MWRTAELWCILLALNLANALLLDKSCYATKFEVKKGDKTINLIEQGFGNVRKNLAGMVAELKKQIPTQQVLDAALTSSTAAGTATSMNPHFALHFMNLFQGQATTALSPAQLNHVKSGGIAGAEALLHHFGQITRFPANSDPAQAWPANIPATETIVYCDLSRFSGKLDATTQEYKHTINGDEDILEKDDYDECIENPNSNNIYTKALTMGRLTSLSTAFPRLRNNMQLCPQWLRILMANGGIDNYEHRNYYAQLTLQNQHLPNYPWPQVKPITPQKKTLRHKGAASPGGTQPNHISMHEGIWLEHTLFHELTHTSWWEAQVPASPGGTAAQHIGPLDDLPEAESAQTSPGGTVTPEKPNRAYGWDNAVQWHEQKNANTWAFLLDGWFVMNKLLAPLAVDALGELILTTHIKVDPKTKKIDTYAERQSALKRPAAKISHRSLRQRRRGGPWRIE